MNRCRIISDDDDVKIKIYGRDLEELFINATYGLSKVLYEDVDKTSKFIRGAKKIKLECDNKESLFNEFLNKVLSLSNEDNKLYPRVKVLKISPTNLVAQISGVEIEKFDKNIKIINCDKVEEKNNKLELTLNIK